MLDLNGPRTEESKRIRAWTAAMRRGDFEAAHKLSDVIRATPTPDPRVTPRHLQRVWTGEPADGRRVLVRCYRGLGDTIQFARFLPRLADRARSLTVCTQAELLTLLAPLDERIRWLALTSEEPAVCRDVDVEIMELLQLFRVETHTIPRAIPYLHAPAARHRGGRTAIGVVWSAGTGGGPRSMRSEDIAPLLTVPGIEWHSLQHGEHVTSLLPALPVHSARSVLETAREMTALDLVITVDSMPAHLAGALGIPVWTLLPFDADWRWMEARNDSPWYPTMRLFRQPSPGDWRTVVERVRRALEVWKESGPQ
jgi:hypothetical protein